MKGPRPFTRVVLGWVGLSWAGVARRAVRQCRLVGKGGRIEGDIGAGRRAGLSEASSLRLVRAGGLSRAGLPPASGRRAGNKCEILARGG